HCAGFYGLLVDRVFDEQLRQPGSLRAEQSWLRREWEDALASAVGKRAVAEAMIDGAIRRWRRAVLRERAAICRGNLDTAEYASIVLGKVAFLGVAVEAMVGKPRRRKAREIFGLLLLGLQCNDDAADAEDDHEMLGAGMPALLATTDSGLQRSASKL